MPPFLRGAHYRTKRKKRTEKEKKRKRKRKKIRKKGKKKGKNLGLKSFPTILELKVTIRRQIKI